MRRWVARLPFRGQLTFWWSLAFGLLLAVANLAIYAAFDIYLRRDLDRKVRTVAATELASSTDGPGIHLHPLATDALAEGEFADTFVDWPRTGRSGWHRRRFAIVHRSSDSTWSWPRWKVARHWCHGRQRSPRARGGAPRGDPRERYAVMVGLFRDDIDAHLTRLAWLLGIVPASRRPPPSVIGWRPVPSHRSSASPGGPPESRRAISRRGSIRRSARTKSAR